MKSVIEGIEVFQQARIYEALDVEGMCSAQFKKDFSEIFEQILVRWLVGREFLRISDLGDKDVTDEILSSVAESQF